MRFLNARLDYALRATIDLAMAPAGLPVQSRDIAARQEIRQPYLDQVLLSLRRAGLARSVRGPSGGHLLARDAARITVWEVVQAVSGEPSVEDADSVDDGAQGGSGYVVRQLAVRVEKQMTDWLTATTIADLVAETRRLRDALSVAVGM